MQEKVTPRILPGFQELLPGEQIRFNQMYDTIRSVYESFGFLPLDTPVIELSEVLLAKAGGETEKQIYRFQKGENDLSLRFDLTVPLARYVAAHYNDLVFPFKRYQMSKVFRGERPQKGRFREFYQCDIDIIGGEELDLLYDAEIPAIIHQVFLKLGIGKFTIRINNRKILGGFFGSLGLSDKIEQILRILDKMEKIGRDSVLAELIRSGVPEEKTSAILDFISIGGTNEQILSSLRGMAAADEQFREGVEELAAVTDGMRLFGMPEDSFRIDLTIARGLDYYTGTVYETQIDAHPEFGSVCSGGRYDDLAGYYTNKSLPGVGISIGLTRLFYILQEQNMISDAVLTAPADVLILPMTDDLSAAVALASMLRAGGLRVQLYSERKKFKAKIGYADKLGIPFVIFLGEDEIAQHVCALKNMATGVQEAVTQETALETIRAEIARRSAGAILREP